MNEHHGPIYREELLLNCGTSMSKTIQALPQGVTNQSIKDAVLRNHSNLRTVSQRSNAYQQLHQKPDEALQSYNTRYASFFHLAYPELELDNPLSRMHCIHYTSSLYGKLGDEMTGRFNQDLPENLQMAFEKATNFEPWIIMKQSINSRKIHEVNHIDIGQEDKIEINEAHIRNPNYKGKNYDPNFVQNRLKNNSSTNNTSNNYNNNTKSNYESSNQHNSNNSGYGHSKSHQQEKPVNVSVTLHGPVRIGCHKNMRLYLRFHMILSFFALQQMYQDPVRCNCRIKILLQILGRNSRNSVMSMEKPSPRTTRTSAEQNLSKWTLIQGIALR